MKKIIVIILCFMVVMSLASCGEQAAVSGDNGNDVVSDNNDSSDESSDSIDIYSLLTSHVWIMFSGHVSFMKFNDDGTTSNSSTTFENYKAGQTEGDSTVNSGSSTWSCTNNTLTWSSDGEDTTLSFKKLDEDTIISDNFANGKINSIYHGKQVKANLHLSKNGNQEFYVSDKFFIFSDSGEGILMCSPEFFAEYYEPYVEKIKNGYKFSED